MVFHQHFFIFQSLNFGPFSLTTPKFFWRWINEVGVFFSPTTPPKKFGGGLVRLEVSLPLLVPNFFGVWMSEVGGFSSLTGPQNFFGDGIVKLDVSFPLLVPKNFLEVD